MKKCICGNEMTAHDWEHRYVCHRCGRTKEYEMPMTNYDRIKAMSMEEMVAFFKEIFNCPCKFCGLYDDADCVGKCEQGHIKWLEQEVPE